MPDIVLDELSDADARKLYDQLGFRFARGAKDALTTDEQLVWSALCHVMNTPNRPTGPFLKIYGKAKFVGAVTGLCQFMRDSIAGDLQRGEELILMGLILRCMVNWLQRGDIPIMPSSVLNSVDYVAAAVDRSYPGYARAKMLGYLVQR